MASATQHPNHQLISSEDVEGTEVYDMAGKNIGEVDHLMIDKMSGPRGLRRHQLRRLHGPRPQPLPRAVGRLEVRYLARRFPHQHHEQQLKDAPEFSDDTWGDRDWETRTHKHYAAPSYW